MPSAPAPPVPPDDALVALLPPDVDLAAGWRHEAARPVWFGVVWSRLGRADLAWRHWDRVRLDLLQPWIAAERGRVLREFGLHAAAEALEWPALLGADDPIDAAMLRISLAADAVGRADVAVAQRRFAAASAAVAELPPGPRAARQHLRLTWVDAERSFLTGDPSARPPASAELPWWDELSSGPSFPDAYRWGSSFHRAKGLLFGGVVRRDHRLLEAAAEVAPPALAWAVHLARADAGVADAEVAARRAWARIRPPDGFGPEVAVTPTARRLAARAGDPA